MQNALTAIKLITPYCYMAFINLVDAYCLIYTTLQTSEYLKFEWLGLAYKYMSRFTKLLKPVYATLAQMGYVYVVNSWTMNAEKQLCSEGLLEGKTLIEKLAFLISFSKSAFVPCKIIEFFRIYT